MLITGCIWGVKLSMEIQISNKIICQDVPQDLLAELKSKLSFTNPKHLENDRLGYSNWNVPRILKYYEMDNGNITLPRGFIRQLLSLCGQYNVNYQISDNRRTLDSVNFAFNGKLRPFQEIACKRCPIPWLWHTERTHRQRKDGYGVISHIGTQTACINYRSHKGTLESVDWPDRDLLTDPC